MRDTCRWMGVCTHLRVIIFNGDTMICLTAHTTDTHPPLENPLLCRLPARQVFVVSERVCVCDVRATNSCRITDVKFNLS